jgi:sialic acid synthase SpsE
MVRPVQFGQKLVGPGQPVYIVSEIGANFFSLEEGREMVEASHAAGADAVKLQTYRAATLTRPGARMRLGSGEEVSQYEFFQAREVSEEAHVELKRQAERLGMLWFSTPSHPTDVDLLEGLGAAAYKTGSDDVTNHRLLDCVARTGKPMVVSTGMSTLQEVEEAVATIRRAGNDRAVLLHCLVGYPAPLDEANLRVITTLRDAFGLPVGFSDHIPGSEAAVLAVALGAVMLEKHLTLDPARGGPDDLVACDPAGLGEYVRAVRRAEQALGDGRKRIMAGERTWREAGRKSVVAARAIAPGEVLTAEALELRRPADGLPPGELARLIGRRARRAIPAGGLVMWEALEPTRLADVPS